MSRGAALTRVLNARFNAETWKGKAPLAVFRPSDDDAIDDDVEICRWRGTTNISVQCCEDGAFIVGTFAEEGTPPEFHGTFDPGTRQVEAVVARVVALIRAHEVKP